jgi:hypothetical protein
MPHSSMVKKKNLKCIGLTPSRSANYSDPITVDTFFSPVMPLRTTLISGAAVARTNVGYHFKSRQRIDSAKLELAS